MKRDIPVAITAVLLILAIALVSVVGVSIKGSIDKLIQSVPVQDSTDAILLDYDVSHVKALNALNKRLFAVEAEIEQLKQDFYGHSDGIEDELQPIKLHDK